jgi:hypothetical protein
MFILGDPFFRNFYIHYDIDNQLIGIARSNPTPGPIPSPPANTGITGGSCKPSVFVRYWYWFAILGVSIVVTVACCVCNKKKPKIEQKAAGLSFVEYSQANQNSYQAYQPPNQLGVSQQYYNPQGNYSQPMYMNQSAGQGYIANPYNPYTNPNFNPQAAQGVYQSQNPGQMNPGNVQNQL